MSLALTACGGSGDISDLEAYTENTYRDHKPEVEPLPPLKPHAVFVYTASDLKDPFDPANLKEKQAESAPGDDQNTGPDPSRRKEPLEEFPIDSLKLVGMLQQESENWAIITAPDSSTHRLKAGNYMGEFDGKITVINDTSLLVSEWKRNPAGNWEILETEVFLVE